MKYVEMIVGWRINNLIFSFLGKAFACLHDVQWETNVVDNSLCIVTNNIQVAYL
jgi:hypothetical protein